MFCLKKLNIIYKVMNYGTDLDGCGILCCYLFLLNKYEESETDICITIVRFDVIFFFIAEQKKLN